ncbi:MAG TPA: helix-turn-helix transcriptional regulator [Steroidobacteraceae bacterium]|nr:helix-turn-helix transcriptional regulator [Steroidobacteraceae bacterium]
METEVKLNPAGVRKLREAKSWTQEHLASAAGVSLRTIQRMEADGSASAESRLAIAAALGVPVGDIPLALDVDQTGRSSELHRIAIGTRWGYAGLALGTLASAAGILNGSANPEQAGIALGVLGGFAGLAAGAIGVLSQRARHRGSLQRGL